MDFTLIGGVSGSGKSVALAAFEDAGYYAINNLPVPLLAATAHYLQRAGQERVVLALKILDGLSQREIAALLSLSEGYVSKLTARATARLGAQGWKVGGKVASKVAAKLASKAGNVDD